MASNAEDFVLRLHDQVSPSARAAESALAQLEARIEQQHQALSGYEQQLEAAAAKLQAMANTSKGSVNIAAFRKQQEVVASLQQKIDDTAASMDRLGAVRPLANQVSALEGARNAITQAADAVGELESQLALLGGGATASQTDALTQAIDQQRHAVLRAQQAYVAMGGSAKNATSAAGGASAKVTTSAERARNAIVKEAAAVGELEARLSLLQSTEGGMAAEAAVLTRAIEEQRQAVVRAQQAYVEMGGSAKSAMSAGGNAGMKLAAGAAQGTAKTGELADALGGLEGPVGDTVSRGQQLTRVVQALGPAIPLVVIALAVVAILALAAAMVAATIAATKWAIKTADAARSQRLLTASLAVNHKALTGLGSILPRVQAATGMAADDVRKLATELAKAKVPAEHMGAALFAMATATAGGANAEFLAKLQAGLKATGKVPKELAAQMAKFEQIATAKMLSLDAQGATLKRSFDALFKDLKIEGLLTGLSMLVGLLDQNTASGQALKFLMEAMFQPLIDGVAAALPTVRRMFLHITIFALQAYIAIVQFFRSPAGKGLVTGLKIVAANLAGLFALATAGLTLLALPFIITAAAIPVMTAAVGFVWNILSGLFGWVGGAASAAWDWVASSAASAWATVSGTVQSAMNAVYAAVDAAVAWLGSVSLADVGAAMIQGLVAGIVSAPGAVIEAITGVVGGAIAAAKAMLQQNSPSKVFMAIGAGTGEGMAMGIEAEAANVQSSMQDMVAPDVAPNDGSELTAGGTKPGKGGGGRSVEFNNCTFGGDLTKSTVGGWMREWFHQDELQPEPA
jgi:hypothetical protein